MQIFVAQHGQQAGPFSREHVEAQLRAGHFNPQDLAWHEGVTNWMPLQQLLGSAPITFGKPDAGPAQGAAATPAGHEETVQFTGTAGEYFRIWIVNVVLTVLTLGIYAAWAKVRKRRYFYGHTLVSGRGFDYTANPVAILKGNLLVGGIFLAYAATSSFQPRLGPVFFLVFGLAFPWLFYQAMRFNAHYTRYRNVPFQFHGTLGESYTINLGLPLLAILTLGLLWPHIHFRKKNYQLSNLSFGRMPFRVDADSGKYYSYFFKALGIVVLAVIVAAVLAAVGGVFTARTAADAREIGRIAGVGFGIGIYLFILAVIPVYYGTKTLNYMLTNTSIPGLVNLRSTLKVRQVLWLEFTNILAIVFTLGLAIPWAAIRRARYRFSHLHLHYTGDLGAVTAHLEQGQSAIGDAAADVLDFDIAL